MNDTEHTTPADPIDRWVAEPGLVDDTLAPAGKRGARRPTDTRDRQGSGPDRLTMGLLVVATLIAVGGIGFAVGHLTAPSASANSGTGGGTGGGNRGFARASLAPGQTFNPTRGGGLGGVATGISGTVQAINGSTITILEANGTSVTLDLSGGTTYHSETTASAGSVTVGSGVTVQIDTTALAAQSPAPGATGALGGRTPTASSILITQP